MFKKVTIAMTYIIYHLFSLFCIYRFTENDFSSEFIEKSKAKYGPYDFQYNVLTVPALPRFSSIEQHTLEQTLIHSNQIFF